MKIPGKYLCSALFLLTIVISIFYYSIPKDEHKILIDLEKFQRTDNIKISFGNQIFIKNNCSSKLQLKENPNSLEEFLKNCPEDPEAEIYFLNQRAKNSGNNTIKIAVSVPISRPNDHGVFDSIEILNGARLAQRKINRNGINISGKKFFLEIGIIDEGWDGNQEKEKSQTVANYLVNQDVVAVIGHFSSDAIEAAAPIYRKNQLVAISATSTAPRKNNSRNQLANIFNRRRQEENLRLNKYIFRTAPNDVISIKRLIDNYIKPPQENFKRIVIVYETSAAYSKLYKQEFQKQFEEIGGKITNNHSAKQDNCAFEPDHDGGIDLNQLNDCVSKIQSDKPDAVLLTFSANASLALKKSAIIDGRKDNNFLKKITNINDSKVLQILVSDSFYDQNFLSESGMIISVPMENKSLYFTKLFDNTEQEIMILNWRAAMTYDATKAIAKSIENSQNCRDLASNRSNLNKCRQQIQRTLSDKDFIATGIRRGNVQFDPNGDRKVDCNNHDNSEDCLGVLLEVRDKDFKLYKPNSIEKSIGFK